MGLGDEYSEKLCDEKHRSVDIQHCDVIRRVVALEDDKRNRDAAGWKTTGVILIALLSAILSFYSNLIPGGK